MDKLKEQLHRFWNTNPIVFTALLTIVILFYPTGFVHEIGHLSAGYFSDTSCKLIINWDLAVNCETTPQPILLFFALGGIFGMIASASLFLLPKIRSNKGLFVGVSTLTFDHFLKAIFETFAHSAYITNPIFTMSMGVLVILFMLILLRHFTTRAKKKT